MPFGASLKLPNLLLKGLVRSSGISEHQRRTLIAHIRSPVHAAMTLSLALSLLGSLALGFLVIAGAAGSYFFGVADGSGSIALGGGFGTALP